MTASPHILSQFFFHLVDGSDETSLNDEFQKHVPQPLVPFSIKNLLKIDEVMAEILARDTF